MSWSQQDIENRIGFKLGRYTNANHLLGLLGAVVMTGLTYLLMMFVFKQLPLTSAVATMFLRPGNQFTVVPATMFFFVGVVVLVVKRNKLRFQQGALGVAAMPDAPDFVLNEAAAAPVLARIHSLVDHPRHFILLTASTAPSQVSRILAKSTTFPRFFARRPKTTRTRLLQAIP